MNAIQICPEKLSVLPTRSTDTPQTSSQEPIVIQTPLETEPPTPPVVTPRPKTKISITPEQIFLVEEIERVTGDTWSRGNFVNLVRQTDEQTIYAALSVTREKRSLESGVNLGAYFTATLKGMTGLTSLGARPPAEVMTHISMDPSVRLIPRLLHPDEPKPQPVDPDAMKKGWRLYYKGAGVQSMLSLVQRCVPVSVDVERLWVGVRETFPGLEESVLIDRFLDTVVNRARHAERMRISVEFSGAKVQERDT
ncbi:MAG: hypothetical protein ACLQPD_28195 [Desulfomonilaceae bacterium]